MDFKFEILIHQHVPFPLTGLKLGLPHLQQDKLCPCHYQCVLCFLCLQTAIFSTQMYLAVFVITVLSETAFSMTSPWFSGCVECDNTDMAWTEPAEHNGSCQYSKNNGGPGENSHRQTIWNLERPQSNQKPFCNIGKMKEVEAVAFQFTTPKSDSQ